MERIGLAFAHEIGHDFGLAHVPNDFDKEEEQTRINNQLSRQDILWPDIDAMFRRCACAYWIRAEVQEDLVARAERATAKGAGVHQEHESRCAPASRERQSGKRAKC